MIQQQNQSNSGVGMKTKIGFKEPKKHRVFIYDDDNTTMEFVILILKKIFFKNEIDATQIMLNAMKNGNAVVGEYTLDTARSKIAKATELARLNGYPLKFEIENGNN